MDKRVCEHCGVEYKPWVKTQRFCSRNCNRRWWDKKTGRVIQLTIPCICEYCGVWFYVGDRRRGKYCSVGCRNAKKYSPIFYCKNCGKVMSKDINYCSFSCQYGFSNKCNNCGVWFSGINGGDSCSRECDKDKEKEKERSYRYAINRHRETVTAVNCAECGIAYTPLYGNKRRVYCSDECSKRRGRRIGKALRRARKRGGKYESVDPLMILERDNWKCQSCGIKTPKGLRGTWEDNAPEVDHIIPLAAGGWHVNYNLQCLCRKCNQEKGDAVEGQLILFAGVECNA